MKLAIVVSVLAAAALASGQSYQNCKRQLGNGGQPGNGGQQLQPGGGQQFPGGSVGGQLPPGIGNGGGENTTTAARPSGSNADEEESLPSTLFDNLPSFLGITFPGDFNPTATGSNTGPTTTGTRTTSTRTSTRPTSDTKTDTSGGAHPWRQQLVPAVAIALLAAL